jgi:rSAM/selenodomain-associated transferase 1
VSAQQIPSPRYAAAIVVFAKAPEPGAVKTRLCPPLSPEQAAGLQTACLQDLWARLGRLRGVHPVLCHHPPGSADRFRALLGDDSDCLPQPDGGLGDRLIASFQTLFDRGLCPVAAIGADSPDLPLETLAGAFQALETGQTDVAVAPAADGGYTLIGMSRPQPALFEAIPWSTSGVFAATLERCRQAGLQVLVLPEWYDVDDSHSLTRLCASVRAHPDELPHLDLWLRSRTAGA